MSYETPQDPFNSQPQYVRAPKRRRPRLLLVALLAFALAAGLITLAAVIPRLVDRTSAQPAGNSSSSNSQPNETQVECVNIRHAYVNWSVGLGTLTKLVHQTNLIASLDAERLVKEADAFKAAANGYADMPSKKLYGDVLQYRFDVGLLDLQLRGGGAPDLELHAKALESWKKADASYSSFLALTCA